MMSDDVGMNDLDHVIDDLKLELAGQGANLVMQSCYVRKYIYLNFKAGTIKLKVQRSKSEV